MENRLLNRVNILINRAYYTASRYNVPATFAYLYHEESLTPKELGKYVRKSDYFVKVDANHYFIHFAHTEQDNAFKASQNLLHYLDRHFNNTSSSIAIDTFNPAKSPKIVYNRLVQILDTAKKSHYSRIEDENILNGMNW